MGAQWNVDDAAHFHRRLGKTAVELDKSTYNKTCPEIWELDNGDVAVVGRDMTRAFADRLPTGLRIGSGERLVVIPGDLLSAAKPDIRDAHA